MKASPIEKKLFDMVEPVVTDLGLRLYWVSVTNRDSGLTVQIIAEEPDTGRLNIDNCEKISNEVSALFDVEDPISSAYTLEVSSPGIDRYLVSLSDYDRYKGFDVKIELEYAVEDEHGARKRFRGIIDSVTEENIILIADSEKHEIPHECVKKAKLVLSDRLIKETADMSNMG